jgi:transcriptional regulator with XRE-family HTH domain
MLHSLNENIKRMRIARGMSQVEFARCIGVTKQCVSNWEIDNVIPSIEMLIKIADVFNVRTDLLLGREGDEFIDVSGLTDEQRGHIAIIVKDFEMLNKR